MKTMIAWYWHDGYDKNDNNDTNAGDNYDIDDDDMCLGWSKWDDVNLGYSLAMFNFH